MAVSSLYRERMLLQALVAAAWLGTYVLTFWSPVSVNYYSFVPVLGVCGFMYLLAVICNWRGMRLIGLSFETVAAGLMLTLPVLISTYLAIGVKMPLADPQLIAMDNALGFNWHSLINLVNATPWLETILALAYSSFSLQLMLIPVILIIFGQPKRALAFVAGYGVLCFISSLISIWYPALGTYTMYGVSQMDVPNIKVKFGFDFLEEFNAIRENPTHTIELAKAAGVLTFPSVHAGIACLSLWAMWSNVYFRYPFLILDLFMNLSAITHANHYLIDVIAGAGIAGITVAIVSYVFLGQRFVGFASELPLQRPTAL